MKPQRIIFVSEINLEMYVDSVFWILGVFTVLYQLSFFFIAYVKKFDKVTDFAGINIIWLPCLKATWKVETD